MVVPSILRPRVAEEDLVSLHARYLVAELHFHQSFNSTSPLFCHCLLFDLLKERCLVILVDHLLEKVLAGYQVFRLQNRCLTNFTFYPITTSFLR